MKLQGKLDEKWGDFSTVKITLNCIKSYIKRGKKYKVVE